MGGPVTANLGLIPRQPPRGAERFQVLWLAELQPGERGVDRPQQTGQQRRRPPPRQSARCPIPPGGELDSNQRTGLAPAGRVLAGFGAGSNLARLPVCSPAAARGREIGAVEIGAQALLGGLHERAVGRAR